jgi:hypothetical protein
VTTLADAVLPLIRTRADLSRWSASNAHGRQIHEAVDNLDAAIPTTDPAEVYAVTHKVLASGIKVIARADDFSGIIGDACRRLLELHPTVAAVPAGSLVDWMVRFQFDGDVDYFEIDPVAYGSFYSHNQPNLPDQVSARTWPSAMHNQGRSGHRADLPAASDGESGCLPQADTLRRNERAGQSKRILRPFPNHESESPTSSRPALERGPSCPLVWPT